MSAPETKVLLKMLMTLVEDLQNIQQRGAGYYDSESFVSRYNRLLEAAADLFPDSRLMKTFSPIESSKSVDPADKMKLTHKVHIETDQLIAFVSAQMD